MKTELKEIVNKKFKVREGETEHKLSLLGAARYDDGTGR